MEKRKIVIPRLLYERAQDEDTSVRIGIDSEKSLMRSDDRDIVLDLSEQFNEERNRSKQYKIYGKMRMVFTNPYYGTSNYIPISKRLYLLGNGSDGNFTGYLPYNEFAFLRNDIRRESIEDIIVDDVDSISGVTLTLSGSTDHIEIYSAGAYYHNWGFYLSYVEGEDNEFPMSYTLTGGTKTTFLSGDGIPFRVYDFGVDYGLYSPVVHGVKTGEYLIIDGIPYYVNGVGNTTYNSEKYVLYISKSQVNGSVFSSIVVGKRCIDVNDIEGTTSRYYVHKHRVISNVEDYNMDKAGFESPIWEDEKKIVFTNSLGENNVIVEKNRMESVVFDFKAPIVLTGITNNLGYTPTEIYVSTVFRNGNGYFNYPPKIGYSFHLHDSWVDDHFDGDTVIESGITFTPTVISGITFDIGNVIEKGNILRGAFVEYNPLEMTERIISEALHKISPKVNVFDYEQTSSDVYSGVTETNPVGILYQPHYRFKLRELSPYVEEYNKDIPIQNLPENAVFDQNTETWRWRDLYDHGYIDDNGNGTDYPFLNNTHYVHQIINFYIRGEKGFTHKRDGAISFFVRGDRNICPDVLET